MKLMRKWLSLILITLLAGLLRFWNLGSMPPSANWDEISHGYNAYSLLQTGQDEWGKSFPLIFRAFGDYKLPLYIYLTIIPVFLFGLNVFAVRFVSALAGTLAIPGIYFLYTTLFPHQTITVRDRKINFGLIAAFVLAVLPWHFFLSRPALEANLALTLIIYGAYFLLKSRYLPASILLALSLHTYNTERIFVPLFLLAFVLIKRKEIKFSKTIIISFLIFLFSASLVGYQMLSGVGMARYEKLKILSPNTIFQIGEWRQNSHLPSPLPTLLYNRPVYFVKTVIANYLGYFSPQFIFQQKGAQTQFAIPQQNLYTWPVLFLALIGLYFCLKSFKNKNPQILLAWLLLSPLAASVTADPPQAIRPNPLIPAVVCLSVLGLYYLTDRFNRYAGFILSLYLGSALVFFGFYLHIYNTTYAQAYSGSWQYGYQQMLQFVSDHQSQYSRIFITKKYGEPHIFYAFFNKLNPKEIQPGGDNIRFYQSDWYWTDKIGKVYFVNDWDIPDTDVYQLKLESGSLVSTANSLLISSDHAPRNVNKLETINFLNGQTAFIISAMP